MGAAGLLLLLLAATCYATGRSSPVDKLYSPHTGPLLRDRVAARRLPALPRPSSPRPSPAVLEEALGATANPFPFGLADPVPPQRHPEHNKHTASKLRAGGETRLPTHVVPTRYKIVIAPELEKGYFIATTDIYLNVLQPTTSIVLNAVDLNLMGVEMHRYSGEFDKYFKYGSATIRTASSDTEGQITVELSQGLVPGEHYLLRFPEFVPYLRTDLAGFYLSSYKDGDGRTRLLGVTQFESNAARMAFPCFDEPTFKARFKIIIEHPQDLGVRSNMPIIRQTQPALTMIRTEFDESLPMSTYLVAWTVSDFQGYSDFSGFTTWARADLMQNEAGILLGQRVGPAVLREMEEFTGIPYALPKVDQFAIPDFAAGAMENWGLVTYREPYLIETKETDVRIRHFIGTTVCHELGHQWTGNLVTLDWWSNTWLNEGFATYFESVICDQILPEWDLMDMFVPEAVHVAIANDVIPNQLAMSSPIPDDNLASTKFDRISYKKGGSVLRMFEHMIGTEVFKSGLERYLKINALKNGSPESLFRAMQAEVQKAGVKLPEGATFQDVAKSWTEQSGVPVLHAKRNYDQGSIVFSQEQFLYETPSIITEKKWYIPIPLPVNPKMVDPWTSTLPEFWLTPDTKTKEVDVDAAKSEWVLINPKQIGYYLVNYDEANWKLLLAALTSQPNNNDIHPASRAQLLHDVMALARAGHVKYTTALPFLQTLSVETAVAPWKAAVDAIAFLRDRLASSQAAAVLQRFVRDLTEEGYGKLGFVRNTDPADPDNTRYLRYYVASLACWAGHSPCTRDAERTLEAHLRDGAGMDADTATTAWCYGVRDSKTNFERVLQLWQDGKDPTSQATHAAALSCTSDQEQLRRILDGLLDPSSSRSTEKASLFINSILQRWEHHHFLVEYYKQNWSKISAYGGSDYHITILKALIRDVRSEEEHEDMVALVKSVVGSSTSSLSGELTASLESAKKGLSWQRSNYQAVTDWLYAATNTSPPTTPAPAPAPSSTEPPATTATATPSSATQTSFAVGLIFGGLLAQRLWN